MKKLYPFLLSTMLVFSGCGSMTVEEKPKEQTVQENVSPQQAETAKEETEQAEQQSTPTDQTQAFGQTEEPKQEEPKAEEKEEETPEEAKPEEQPEEPKNDEPVKNTPPEIVNQFSNGEEYNPDIDINSLSNEAMSWGFKRNKEHQPVTAYYKADLSKYGTYYLGDTSQKVVYLTFDEGYENGFTPAILDTLKEKQVKAAFFITGSYLKHNPELVKRMKAEGHVVANHSQTHPDFTTKSDEEVIAEVNQVGDKYKKVVGVEMDPFFRFPSGRYSERDLYIVRKLGYRNIFWSMAHKDWEVNNQPGKEVAYQHVMDNYHNGAIILLHAVSSSNTEALSDIITGLDEAGYRFGSLYELE